MKLSIQLTVNGESYDFDVEPHKTLLDVIRDDLSLTGTKEGCGAGDCGACTVLLDGRAVNSCLFLAVDANGREVTTIEGLAEDGSLHRVQREFLDHGAVQCGYCTPGMIMSTVGLLAENPRPSEFDARRALAGNLCRCTGYVKILEAVMSASEEQEVDE